MSAEFSCDKRCGLFLDSEFNFSCWLWNSAGRLWVTPAFVAQVGLPILVASHEDTLVFFAWKGLIFDWLLVCSVREMCSTEDVDITFRHFRAFFQHFTSIDEQLRVDV